MVKHKNLGRLRLESDASDGWSKRPPESMISVTFAKDQQQLSRIFNAALSFGSAAGKGVCRGESENGRGQTRNV